MKKRHQLKNILLFVIIFLLGCSTERKNVFSKFYHNTTSKYNSHFYAKQRIEEIDNILEESIDDNYDKILNIYPTIDSTLAKSYESQIEDCIKKASVTIQRHKNSDWVDNCYTIIGMARHRSLDFVNAIDTYKYVNTHSKNDNARHEALIRLIRVFVDYEEYQNAVEVEYYLNKQNLNRKNRKLFLLYKAYHRQIKKDYDGLLKNLVDLLPYLSKKDNKDRIYFIIGQLYQMKGLESTAFHYYKKCLSTHPKYELDFHTRLKMAQVSNYDKKDEIKSSRKLLYKLLRDAKNKDFMDKILYEMGKFEFKNNNNDLALEHLQSSVKESMSNPRQKGLSYLKIGEIYYDTIKNFELAQSYYDSAIQSLPSDFDKLGIIKERADVLDKFVEQLKTIELQDSLLELSQMDSVQISMKLNEIIKNKELKKRLEEEKQQKKEQLAYTNANLTITQSAGNMNWYFDNLLSVSQGVSDFKNRWGNRKLEDNWRISNKINNDIGNSNESINSTDSIENFIAVSLTDSTESIEENKENQYNNLYNQLPFNEKQKNNALQKIETAYYKLANIYRFNLKEEDNAIVTFKKLIKRFPQSEYYAEALYQLHLIYKFRNDEQNIEYFNELKTSFPNSLFAKLAINPNYREETLIANEKLKTLYEEAYNHYKKSNYDSALTIIKKSLKDYEKIPFSDRFELLKIMITGKIEDISIYEYDLNNFINNNPESEMLPVAKSLLNSSKKIQERTLKRLGNEFSIYLEQSHYYILIYESKSNLSDLINSKINAYNKDYNKNLKTSSLNLNKNLTIKLISDFENKDSAMDYFNQFNSNDPLKERTRDSNFYKFVITKDNFNIFYQNKDIEQYLSFFKTHYY